MGDLLKDKVGIVTGSGRGIGRGVALMMASEGAKMVVNDLGGAVDGSGNSSSPADDVVAESTRLAALPSLIMIPFPLWKAERTSSKLP